MKQIAVVVPLIPLIACSHAPQVEQPAVATKPPALRCCVMQDLSGSIAETRTPRLTEAELRSLLGLVMARGGEVAFGIIQDRSDRPLLRLAVGEPPPPPPPEPANPLYRRRWKAQRADAERARQAWDGEQQDRVAAFLKEIAARLEGPLARSTDVCGAIRRCDLMLGEPSTSPVIRYMLLVTDGEHNLRRSVCPETVADTTRLLLVNGSGLQGIVERYRPLRFEAVSAAVKYIQEDTIREP